MTSDSPLFREPNTRAVPHPPTDAPHPLTKEGDTVPRCKVFISIEHGECGKPAPHRVQVPLGKARAFINLCDEHKAVHDANNAARRAARRAARDSDQ